MENIDSETRASGQINARRNYLLALWAGRQLDMPAHQLPGYVTSVMQSDFEEPGPHDVVRKVQSDFHQRGIAIDETRLLRQLQIIEKSVRAELLATD